MKNGQAGTIDSSVGLVPTNALVSIKWNGFPHVGHTEAIIGWHVDEKSAIR